MHRISVKREARRRSVGSYMKTCFLLTIFVCNWSSCCYAEDVPFGAFRKISSSGACYVTSMPIFDAAGYWFQGQVSMCNDRLAPPEDVTPGRYAASPGQQIIQSNSRFEAFKRGMASRPHGFLFRGVPNVGYKVLPDEEYAYFAFHRAERRAGMSWEKAETIFPFVPTRYCYFTDPGINGVMIAYGGLKIPLSLAKHAAPLDSQSIVLMLNGNIAHDPGLIVYLSNFKWAWSPLKQKLVEVVYVQADETPQVVRRAFIPLLDRANINQGEWAAAISDPAASWAASDDSSPNGKLAKDKLVRLVISGMALGAIALGQELYIRYPGPDLLGR